MSWDLPDWIENRLEFDNNRSLQQHHVAEIFVHGERPYYNVRRIKSELKNRIDPDTIRGRLNEMEELGVIDQETINNGTIYWLVHESSNWPIPNDVRVESDDNEMTIREFFAQFHIQVFSLGVFLSVISGIVIWVGSLQAANIISFHLSTNWLLAAGLTAILFSYGLLVLACLIWVLQKGVEEADDTGKSILDYCTSQFR